MRNFLAAFGHVAMDYIVSLRRLPTPNTSIEILDRKRYFGGTAGNLARAAARLGVKVSLASFVGADFPADYRVALNEDRVDTTDLRTVRNANTPTVWVFSDPKGNQMAIVDQGPMKDAAHLPLLRHSVKDVDLVHIGTGRPEYYLRVARLASSLGKTAALGSSPQSGRRDRCGRRVSRGLLRRPGSRARPAPMRDSRIRGRKLRRREERDAVQPPDVVTSSLPSPATCNVLTTRGLHANASQSRRANGEATRTDLAERALEIQVAIGLYCDSSFSAR